MVVFKAEILLYDVGKDLEQIKSQNIPRLSHVANILVPEYHIFSI